MWRVILVMVPGCRFVLGIDDLELAPIDASGIEDGSGGDGGIDASDASTAPDAACSTDGLNCPGSAPILFDCGVATDCWVGCSGATPITPLDAAARCAAWGGRLAPIYSPAELTCVHDALGGAMWLGLTQAPSSTDTDSGWDWNGDGMALTYVNWATGQPNDADGAEDGDEQCAYATEPASDWHDTPCTNTLARWACRKP